MKEGGPILAVDLGGTRLRGAFFDGARLGVVSSLAHAADRERPLPVDRLAAWLGEMLAGAPVTGIGISIAGTVEVATGAVSVADNLGWRDLPLADLLKQALGLPVRVDTDTFCGARAEACFGNAAPCSALLVVIGTGIGHAWIVDGRVWRGASRKASMFGHLVVRPDGRSCYCGGRGCLCQYAAGPAIRAAIEASSESGSTPALAEASSALALAIAQALTLINPREVILNGGAVTERWPELEDLTRRVEALVHPEVRPIRIRRSALGESANLLGAGLLFGETTVSQSMEQR